MRYFFDYRAQGQSLLDYRGEVFSNFQSAIEFAEATAEFLTQSLANDWTGWSIEVRNASGDKLISLPVADRRPVCGLRPVMQPAHSSATPLPLQ